MFFAKRTGVTTAVIVAVMASVASLVQADAPYTPVDLYPLIPPAGVVYWNPSPATSFYYHPMQGGQLAGYESSTSDGNQFHGLLWSSTGVSTVMTPTNLTGYSSSQIFSAGGNQQAGWGGGTATGYTSTNDLYHAMIWNGSANTAVDLHPTLLTGFTSSVATATDGTRQAGYALTGSNNVYHAMAWSGTADSAVDLNPTQFANYDQSVAFGVSGNQQVGYMTAPDHFQLPQQAVLWNGTAASAVSLDPVQLESQSSNAARGSVAYGIGGGKEVGFAAVISGQVHAILWSGTAASAVDLNPAGSSNSEAFATNGVWQVGYTGIPTGSQPPYLPNAMVWKGTADSAVNLQSLLPSNFGLSTAYDVNSAGDVFGMAEDTSGYFHAIEWVAAPHVATGAIAGGSNQTATIAGRGDTFGQVDFKFSTATTGTLSNTSKLVTTSALAASTAAFNFQLPTTNSLVQAWDLSFTGTFTGSATLTFHYDPSDLQTGIDPTQLQIEHFTNGQWVALAGVVDPVADTITVETNSFSPFALGSVPEPSAIGVLVLGLAMGLRRVRREGVSY
jgi:hypothetical protein